MEHSSNSKSKDSKLVEKNNLDAKILFSDLRKEIRDYESDSAEEVLSDTSTEQEAGRSSPTELPEIKEFKSKARSIILVVSPIAIRRRNVSFSNLRVAVIQNDSSTNQSFTRKITAQ